MTQAGPATGWRPLTEAELATWPKARLGGALAGVVVLTGVLTLALVILLIAAAFNLDDIRLFLAGYAHEPSPEQARLRAIQLSALTILLTLMVGAAVVFVMTLARARATPVVAGLVAFAILLTDIGGDVWRQTSMAGSIDAGTEFVVMTLASQTPRWLWLAVLVVGFSGYMLGGVRPNAYFRRRIAVPGGETK